jgi:hypothetical protein
MTDAQMQVLHDRATRGEQLTADERAQLEVWYLRQDQAESQLLRPVTPAGSAAQLQEQVTAAAAQLEAISQQIRATLAENEQVRHEIALLQHQLSQRADRAA